MKSGIELELESCSPKLREMYLYLHAHHCAAQSYIGIARLHMTLEQKKRMEPFDPALSEAYVDHLLFCLRDSDFSDSDVISVFNVSQEELDASRARGSLLEQEQRRRTAVLAASGKTESE